MTPTHAPTPVHAPRTAGDVIRGLLAVIALAAFFIGVPASLLTVAPMTWPRAWPTWEAITSAMTRPDDGSLLLGTIVVIAWVAWAGFTIAAGAEIVATARHLRAPHLPMLRGPQHLAATLVTAAGLLLATTAPSISSASAQTAATDVAPTVPGAAQVASDPLTKLVLAARVVEVEHHRGAVFATGPVVTVVRGDTLWGLAERHLGDGTRYTEILDLNLGQPQPDGRTLTDTHWIYPGWKLHLPDDAHALPATPSLASAEVATASSNGRHTVVPGDTLWDIAATDLGDPHRYAEIVGLNLGVPQPDGRALTDPDVIDPGWSLALPDDANASLPATDLGGPIHHEQAPVPSAQSAPAQITTPDDATSRGDDATAPANEAAAPTDGELALSDDARDEADDDEVPADPPGSVASAADDDAPSTESFQMLFLGLTALAAAGVIGELARRRMLQHRARRIGQRIALPAVGSPAADAERTLRAAPTGTIPMLKQALLNLAARCYAAERDLPRLAAINFSPDQIVLHLTDEDTDVVVPFTTTGPRTWIATYGALVGDAPIDDPDRPEPFPALVTLGHTPDGTVLLNLEAAGTLTVTGEGDGPADLLRALVAELATSDLTGRVGLIADPQFTALAQACDPARLQIATPQSITAQLASRTESISRALSSVGTDDTLQARSDRVVEDVWLPVVYVTPATASTAPWSGSTVIGLGNPAPYGWTLHHDGVRATLEPLGLTLQPQRLSKADLDTLVDLLTTATPPGEEPAPTQAAVQSEIVDVLSALPVDVAPSITKVRRFRINVLGPITIDGLPAGDRLSRRSTELLVCLALRRQASGPELDEALWHGVRVERRTRNSLVYRTRQRVGPNILPTIDADGIYRLGEDVACDWTEFQALAHRGLAAGPEGIADLQAALDLVRDRPILGVPDSSYTWAEYDIQNMIGAIADTAHVLARMHAEIGDHRAAMRAATKGLLADPCSELLYAQAIAAAEAMGDFREAGRLSHRLHDALSQLDPEFV